MSAGESLTVWVPIDPERVRARLAKYGIASPAYIDDCETELSRQGYRFNSAQLAELRAITDKYRAQWCSLVESMTIERIGPPAGKVAPPEADEFYRRTGRCLVTAGCDDPPNASRSRH